MLVTVVYVVDVDVNLFGLLDILLILYRIRHVCFRVTLMTLS